MHGYDVVDHNQLNPEIGDARGFREFVAALRSHNMGHILDIVPNHVGIMGSDNAWWMDVLENGEASRYADYFDIEWNPANPALKGKVLVPVLGGPYGDILEKGELVLRFERELARSPCSITNIGCPSIRRPTRPSSIAFWPETYSGELENLRRGFASCRTATIPPRSRSRSGMKQRRT